MKTIQDLQKTPELYGDHAFLVYVLTDGANNINNGASDRLSNMIKDLADNYTVAVLVPDRERVFLRQSGLVLPANNLAVWSTNGAGIEEVGKVLSKDYRYLACLPVLLVFAGQEISYVGCLPIDK